MRARLSAAGSRRFAERHSTEAVMRGRVRAVEVAAGQVAPGGIGAMNPALFAQPTPLPPSSGPTLLTVVIDAEEDFDWPRSVGGVPYSTACMKNVRDLQPILGAHGVVPTYLLTYPILRDADVVRILRRQLDLGQCAVGLHLHPWVTPPFAGPSGIRESFSGNLPAALEEQKLLALREAFVDCFGFAPTMFRAGRYGLGPRTASLLERHGFEIDTSLAPLTSFAAEQGPDYTAEDSQPFWFGRRRRLLEVPLCRDIAGWGGAPARALYRRHLAASGPVGRGITGFLARLRCSERITLSPEGNDLAAMQRLAQTLRRRGRPVCALSFHSSSIAVGRNPYVHSKADLHGFYDRLSGILDVLTRRWDFRPVRLDALPAALGPAQLAAA